MSTDTMDRVKKLVGDNPQHAVPAARKFEQLHRSNPDDRGYRLVFWELQRQVDKLYPITRPVEVDPPDDAWGNEDHVFWKSDPWTVWDMTYARMRRELGWINARMIVSELQQAGQDLI